MANGVSKSTRKRNARKRGKQPSKAVLIDGIKFDSATESERYLILRQAEQFGIIQDLECHPKFELAPQITLPTNALRPRAITLKQTVYTGDFSYVYQDLFVVEDVKGAKKGTPFVTPASSLRHRLLKGERLDVTFLYSIYYRNAWVIFFGAYKTQKYPCPIEIEVKTQLGDTL